MFQSIYAFITAVLAAALTSTVASQALTQWWTDKREAKKLNRDAGTSALRIAVALELFAEQCVKMYDERKLHDRVQGHDGVKHQVPPPPPVFTDEIEWSSIDNALSNRAMTFDYLVRSRSEILKSTWSEYSDDLDDDEFSREFLDRVIELGSEALSISVDVRNRYGLDARDKDAWWMVSTKLAAYRKDIERYEERRRVSDVNRGSLT